MENQMQGIHRQITELQALLRAVQLAQMGAGDNLADCIAAARVLLARIEEELLCIAEI